MGRVKDIADYMDGESWVYIRKVWRGYVWSVCHFDFGFSVGRTLTFNQALKAAGMRVAYPENHEHIPPS